jgi:hypothetical protein
VTVSKGLKDALGPLMLKHKLGLYVLKATQAAPVADRLTGRRLLMLRPSSEPDFDFEAARAVAQSGTSIFSGFESYSVSDNVSCAAAGKPCISISETQSNSDGSAAVKILQNLFGKNTSTKDIVAYCTRRMRDNQGVLLASRDAAAAASGELLELVFD